MSAADHRERYIEHSRRLQTWLGAYAAGLASLLVIHFRDASEAVHRWSSVPVADATIAKMAQSLSCSLRLIGFAIAAQVALLLLNKITQFVIEHIPNPNDGETCCERAAQKISNWFWLDVLADVVSISLLVIATMRGLNALGLSL